MAKEKPKGTRILTGISKSSGLPVFRNPETRKWEPLVDGESTYTGGDGVQRVFDANAKRFRKVEGISDLLMKGVADANTIIPSLGNMLGLTSDEALAAANRDVAALENQYGVMSPDDRIAMQEMQLANEQGFIPAAKAVLSNPGTIARQLTRALPTMGMGAVGAFAAGPGAIAAGVGGAASGTAVEAGSSFLNNLEQVAAGQGENLSDPNALARVKNRVDPTTGMTGGQMATQAATQRAALMAPFTGLAAGRAATTAANLGMRSVVQGVGEQAVLGAAGEAAGQLGEKGRVYSPTDIIVEGLAEGVFGVPEFAGHYIKNRRAQGVSEEEAANEAAAIEQEAEKELWSKPQEYQVLGSQIAARMGQPVGNDLPSTKKFAKAAARLKAAEKFTTNPTQVQASFGAQPQRVDARLGNVEERMVTPGLQRYGEEQQYKNLGLSPEAAAITRNQRQQQRQLPTIVPGGTTKDLTQARGLTKQDIARIKEEQRAEQGRKERLAAIEARRTEEANRAPTELYRPRQITDRSNERQAQNVAAGNAATQAAMTALQRNRKIGQDAKAMATARAAQAYNEMKGTKGFNEDREAYIKRYSQNLLPDIAEELRTNPDYLAGKATPERVKGRFTGKLVAPAVEPGVLLTTERNQAQRELADKIAPQSELRSQEQATQALPPQMQQAATDMGIEAFSQQQAAARAQRQADALATTQAAQQAILPETTINPVTGNKRVKPKGNKRKYSKFQGNNVVDITKQLADKRDSFEAQQEAKARAEQRSKLQREGDTIVLKLLAALNLTGKVNPLVVLEKLADGAGGYVEGATLVISALQPEGREFMDTFNHEVIHILRNLGLFTPQEWQTLSRAAEQNGWVETYLGDNPAYADLNPEERLEEAIAEHFAQTAKIKDAVSTPTTGLVNKLGKRISDFFKALRMYVEEALGITTPEEVLEIFDAIQNGTIGLRNNDLVNPENNPIKYSKLLSSKINDTKKYALSQEAQDNLAKTLPRVWPIVGDFFSDITTLAGRIPAVRAYRNALAEQRRTDHVIRNQAAAFLTSTFKDIPKNEMVAMTKAAVALRLNDEAPKWPADGKGMIVTLNNKFPGIGEAGTKIALTAAQVEKLKALHEHHKSIGNRWINAVGVAAMGHLKTTKGFSVSQLLKGIPDVLTALETAQSQGLIDSTMKEEAKAILDTLKGERSLVNDKFYIPFIRTSPFFLDFTNEAGDKATYAMPTNMLGNALPGRDAVLKFANARLLELRQDDPTYNTDLKIRKVDAVKDWSITERELSAFEKLALLATTSNNKEVNNSEDIAKKIFASLRKDMAAKGFKQNWVKSKDIPGFVHSDNIANYLTAAETIYADRAARGISIAESASEINKALADVAAQVKDNKLHPSVLKAVSDHYDYLTNPELQEGTLSNKMRMLTFHMMLGMNPASALLNLFQTLHTTLPVLVAMTGQGASAIKEITKASLIAHKFLNLDLTNPDVFKSVKSVQGVPEDVKRLVQNLIDKGSIKVIITEELQAKSSSRGIVGGQTERETKYRQWLENYANVSASMFSRTEAMNRIIAAVASYNIAKQTKNNPKAQAKLKNYLATTAFSDINLSDPEAVAEAAVELSQFDTSQFNRAKAFRGALALPTQFLAFPVRMVQLYIDLLRNSLGSFNADGTFAGFRDSQTKAAFVTMLLGLFATSGMLGMFPVAGAGADAYDKIMNAITGVDPDIKRKLRETMVDFGGPMFGEIMMKGPANQIFGADIGDRVGASLFSGIQTDFSVFDLLGPTGGLIEQVGQAGTRLNQGHELLAVGQVMPPLLRNIGKAYYEGEYGIVSQQGNLLPTDYSPWERTLQSIGFTPTKVRETRDVEFGKQRLTATSSVLRERFTDKMTAARVKMALASRRGQSSSEYAEEFRQLRQELMDFNKKATPEEKIPVDKVMATVVKRTKEQFMAATQNRTSERRIPADKRGIIKDKLTSVYPGGYTTNE